METRFLVAYTLILLLAAFFLVLAWRATAKTRGRWYSRRKYPQAKLAARDQMDAEPETIRIVGRGPPRNVAQAPDD